MQKIVSSVGRGGKNSVFDVKVVQQLLNMHQIPMHTAPLQVDGVSGPKTISRIEAFQKYNIKMVRPDGRVDPHGKTFAALTKTSASTGKNASSYQLSTNGLDLLKLIEQLRLNPYDDQTSKDISSWVKGATIGYGHLISQGEWNTYKNGINATQAETLLKQDLQPYVNSVKLKVTANISQNQFDALVIFTFNIGVPNFESSSVLKLVNNPAAITSYSSLEAAWKAWNKSQGKVMQGLKNRRESEWNIYSKNVYKKW